MLAYLATHLECSGRPRTAGHYRAGGAAAAPAPPRARRRWTAYAEEGEKVLAPVVKFLARHGVKVKTCRLVGPAGETIAKVANPASTTSSSWAHMAMARWASW